MVDMSILYDTTGFQRDALGSVAMRDGESGQSIRDDLTRWYGTSVAVDNGRLYPNLDALVNNGLVEKGTLDRRTNSYTVTPEGYQLLKELLARYGEVVEALEGEF